MSSKPAVNRHHLLSVRDFALVGIIVGHVDLELYDWGSRVSRELITDES